MGTVCVIALRRMRRVGVARARLRALLDAEAGTNARIVITGATSGLGEELARQFAKHPSVQLLLGCRDEAKGRRMFGKTASVQRLDLLDPDSVQNFVDETHLFLNEGGEGLRLLINNAGVMKPPGGATASGIDKTWQTNFLGPFLLTELLALRRNVRQAPLRVVQVSSRLEKRSKLDFDLLEAVGKGQAGEHAYADSKRAMMFWTSVRAQSMAMKANAFVHVATPGMVDTQLGRNSVPPWLWPLTKPIRWMLLRSSAEGALGIAGAGLRKAALKRFGRYCDGEEELEDLVLERMGEKHLALKVVKWAETVTALDQRYQGYSR